MEVETNMRVLVAVHLEARTTKKPTSPRFRDIYSPFGSFGVGSLRCTVTDHRLFSHSHRLNGVLGYERNKPSVRHVESVDENWV